MACIEDDLREREAEEFGKGLHSKVKLDLYRRFGGELDSCLSLDQEHMV